MELDNLKELLLSDDLTNTVTGLTVAKGLLSNRELLEYMINMKYWHKDPSWQELTALEYFFNVRFTEVRSYTLAVYINPKMSEGVHVRAIRFPFQHTTWEDKVVLINMDPLRLRMIDNVFRHLDDTIDKHLKYYGT